MGGGTLTVLYGIYNIYYTAKFSHYITKDTEWHTFYSDATDYMWALAGGRSKATHGIINLQKESETGNEARIEPCSCIILITPSNC